MEGCEEMDGQTWVRVGVWVCVSVIQREISACVTDVALMRSSMGVKDPAHPPLLQ